MMRIGIVGCGDMGHQHAGAWTRSGHAVVAAVFDPDHSRASAMADAHQADTCPSWQALTARADIDVVSVCTPAVDHAPVSLAAIAHGHHVLCEKPMALTLAEADAMISAAEAAGVRLAIGHQYRWTPGNRTMAKLIASGALGGPVVIRFEDRREVRPKTAMHSARLSGGPIQDMTGHWFDLASAFTNAAPLSVHATGGTFGAGKPRLEAVDDLAPDTAEILVRYRGGHAASLGICWGLPEGTPAHGGTSVFGPDGLLRSDGDVVIHHHSGGQVTLNPDDTRDPRDHMVADLLAAIVEQRPPTINGSVGRNALALSLAALESLRSGATVALV